MILFVRALSSEKIEKSVNRQTKVDPFHIKFQSGKCILAYFNGIYQHKNLNPLVLNVHQNITHT